MNSPLEYIKEHIKEEKSYNLFLRYYELYEKIKNTDLKKLNYKVNDEVLLKKGTLIHGINSFSKEKIEGIRKNGFIFSEYLGKEVYQQKYCVCFWIMNKDITLKDYINYYSGDTIHLTNRFTKKNNNIYIPFDYDVSDRIKIFKDYNKLLYKLNFTRRSKENQFLPSLEKKDDYVGFILNNSFTNKIREYDIYEGNITLDELNGFLPEWVIKKTIKKKIPTQTDHELSVIFGLPNNLIEGIIVGRLVEQDKEKLEFIKKNFPNAYICNIEGIIII